MPTRTWFVLLAATGFVGFAWAGDLEARRELPERVLARQPAYPHRLIVKFRDALAVRVERGILVSLTGGDLAVVRAAAAQHKASFVPLINLPRETLDFLEQRAERISAIPQPDFAGMMIARAPADALARLAEQLSASTATEFVYFQELSPPPPCEDILPPTPAYILMQTYHGSDPGLNMTAAWALGSARGAGIKIADCEYGYVAGHEDLCNITMEPGQTIHPNVISFGWDEHGTAVFGEMISIDNLYGCTGLVPDARGYFFTEWSVEEGLRRVTAIANAIGSVDPGDIVVLEMQTTGPGGGFGPAELDPAVWMLVRNATDAGIVVVAAAGNGNQNLDSAPYAEYRGRGDSGAIIVGAGSSNANHFKLSFSTYGSRVNVQGWGRNVFTLGYGGFAQHGGDKNQRYTSSFGGTSSATPFVASCAVALQSLAEQRLGRRLTPLELRDMLVRTGIPQGSGGHIGPFPDMVAAAAEIVTRGDLNCDGVLNGADIDPFFLALGNPAAYTAQFPNCDIMNGDMNGDGSVNGGDIDPFFQCLGGTCP